MAPTPPQAPYDRDHVPETEVAECPVRCYGKIYDNAVRRIRMTPIYVNITPQAAATLFAVLIFPKRGELFRSIDAGQLELSIGSRSQVCVLDLSDRQNSQSTQKTTILDFLSMTHYVRTLTR